MPQQQLQSHPGRSILPRGERFAGRFDVLDTAGLGAESIVYKVRDQETGTVLALKVYEDQYSKDPKRREAFLREVELGGRIQHPNVVRILGAGESAGRSFILMEFLSGRTLAETLQISERFSPEEFIPVFRQMAEALKCLHSNGIVHRDIKPGNLMFGADGTLKLMDFGIARRRGEAVTVGVARGTVDYAAPEQLLGKEPTTTSDLYALGAVAHELLTGKQPFRGQSPLQRGTHPPPPLGPLIPRLPATVASAIDRCLDPEPSRRPESVDALLQSAGMATPTEVRSPALEPSPQRPAPPPIATSVHPRMEADLNPSSPLPAAPVDAAPPRTPPPSPPARTLSLLLGDEPRPPVEALSVLAHLLSRIRRITEAGEAHDPITPQTVRLRSNGEPEITSRPNPGDRDTWVISTPRYSAPELLRGETNLGPEGRAAAVLYSAGLVFYEILLGRKNFNHEFRDVVRKSSDLAWMEWQVNESAVPRPLSVVLPGISAEVSALFERLMEKDPAKRLADYREAERSVHRLIQQSAPTEEIALQEIPSAAPEEERSTSRANGSGMGTSVSILIGVAVAVVLAMLSLGVIWWLGWLDLA